MISKKPEATSLGMPCSDPVVDPSEEEDSESDLTEEQDSDSDLAEEQDSELTVEPSRMAESASASG